MSKKRETTRLQRESIAEKLERTEERLTYGAEKAAGFLTLLRQPGKLYRQAENGARRDLILTFFNRMLVEIEDTLDLEGERNEANLAIRRVLPRHERQAQTKISSGETAEGDNQAFKQFACSPGSNKNDVAGVPGLEPRTTVPETAVLPITPYPKGFGPRPGHEKQL